MHRTFTWGHGYTCYLATDILKIADLNSKYDFAPHLENPEETEEMDQNTLQVYFVIPESELACLDTCNDSRACTQTEEARQKDTNAFKIEGKDTFWLKSFQTHQK